jgi:hypothetical protein
VGGVAVPVVLLELCQILPLLWHGYPSVSRRRSPLR